VADQPPSKVSGWLAALIAALTIATATVIGVRQGVKPASPPTATTATTATEPPATVTGPPPVTETQPRPPSPPTAEEAAAVAGAKRRATHPLPAPCTADELDTANHYATFQGYAYLKGRCDLIRRYRQDGGDLVIWLAEHNYDSPAADCGTYRATVTAPPETAGQGDVCLTWHGDERCVSVTLVANTPTEVALDVPCYAGGLPVGEQPLTWSRVIATRTHTITVVNPP